MEEETIKHGVRIRRRRERTEKRGVKRLPLLDFQTGMTKEIKVFLTEEPT